MKKVIAILGLIFLLSANTICVHAGALNEYEAEVVKAAKGQFEFDEKLYRVEDEYVDRLVDYLMLDEVDLTAEQRDKAISTMYMNVKKGVDEGYLDQVEAASGQTAEKADAAGEPADKPKDNQDISQNSSQSNTMSSGSKNDSQEANSKEADTFVEELVNQPSASTNIDMDNNKVTVTNGQNANLLTVNTVIKNTGFDLSITAIMAVGLLAVMAACTITAMKYNFFTQKD